MIRRAADGLLSSMAGWLAAWVCSLPFQLAELVRNAKPGLVFPNLVEGVALWTSFSFSACLGMWLVAVLPASLLLEPILVRRWRWWIMLVGAGFGIYMVGRRLGTWAGLQDSGPRSPFDSVLFWSYSLFGVFYTVVTVERFARSPRPA